ncbi:MAG: LamG domain-containing protein [Halofilum sp. (in: g-proteobacteria)]
MRVHPSKPDQHRWPFRVGLLPLGCVLAFTAAPALADFEPADDAAVPLGGQSPEMVMSYTESAPGEVQAGQIVLQLPSGFEWHPDSDPRMTVTWVESANPCNHINGLNDGEWEEGDVTTATRITFEITSSSDSKGPNACYDKLTFGGMYASATVQGAAGDIVNDGDPTGVADNGTTSWGSLEQVDAVSLSANGETNGPVFVEVGDDVDLAATVYSCPGAGDDWVDIWDIDGDTFTSAPSSTAACDRSPITRTESFDTPGQYTITFTSEYDNGITVQHGEDQIVVEAVTTLIDAELLIDYRMEALDWPSDPVSDSSGNGFHGEALGAAVTSYANPAVEMTGGSGTCRYADLSGSGRIEGARPFELNQSAEFSVAFWLQMPAAEQTGARNSIYSIGDLDGDRGERLEIFRNDTGELEVFFDYTTANNGQPLSLSYDGASGDPFDGQWHHVTVTHEVELGHPRNTTHARLYVDGNLVATESVEHANHEYPALTQAAGDIHIAGFPGDYPASLQIDEIQVYTGALDDDQVVDAGERVFQCASVPSKLRLTVPPDASVCAAADITLTVLGATDEAITSFEGLVNLTTSSGRGNWSLTDGGGTLDNGVADDGMAAYQFVAEDDGSVMLGLFNQSADTLEITAADPDQGIDQTSDPVAFRENAFEIILTDPLGSEVVAGRTHAVRVQAQRQDPSTGECGVNTNYHGDVDLKAWITRSSADPGGVRPELGGRQLESTAPSSDNLTLAFASGEANTSLDTEDVGQYRLRLLDDTSGLVVDESGDPRPVEGASPQATVRPFGFAFEGMQLDGTNNPGTETADGDVFGPADRGFRANLMAVNHQPGNDVDDDGVPDDGAVLAFANPTPSFAADGAITPELESGATVGTISDGDYSEADFNNGRVELTEVKYSEVGAIRLSSTVSDYLDAGVSVTGTSEIVGRFIPDHFTLDDLSHFVTDRAALGCASAFTYIGERFDNDFTLVARSAAGTVTSNYEGSFAHLDEPEELDVGAGNDDGAIDLTIDGASFVWTAGFGDIITQLVADRDTPTEPHEPVRVGIDPSDDDGVTLLASEIDLDISGDGNGDRAETGQTDLLFGRLVLDSAAGVELAPVEMPVRAEYWTGDTWAVNEADDCTALALADDLELDGGAGLIAGDQPADVGAGQTSITTDPIELASGRGVGEFAAPGENNIGGVDVRALTGSDYAFLLGEWEGNDASWGDMPTARVEFGIYRGDDRWIDIRRVR